MSMESPRRHLAGAPEPPEHADRPVDRFRRSAVGSVVAAGLLGLRDALEGRPEREDVEIVGEAPQPHERPAMSLHLDPEHPERSHVVIAPPPTEPGR